MDWEPPKYESLPESTGPILPYEALVGTLGSEPFAMYEALLAVSLLIGSGG